MADDYVQAPPDDTGKKLQTHKNTVGVNDVHAEAVVPVTAAGGELAKAEDVPHASGDKGIVAMAVRKDDPTQLAGADGDYHPLTVDSHGGQHTTPEHVNELDELDDHTAWAILGNDTANLATNTQHHVASTASVQFDKVDGAANTVFAGIDQTIAAHNLSIYHIHESVHVATYISDTSQIDYMFIRLGTDNANYNEWRIDGEVLMAGKWNLVKVSFGAPDPAGATGTGINPSAVTYLAIGYAFDLQNQTLANIRFNHLSVHSSQHTSSDITAEVSSTISSPNVIVRAWGNAVDTNQGNAGNNTLRVAIADDDTNAAAIKTAVELLDDVVQTEDDAHNTGDKGVMLFGVRNDTPATFTNVDLDYIPISCDEYGRVLTRSIHEKTDYPHAFFNAAADGALVAAVGGKVIKVHAMYLQSAGTVVVNIRTNNAAGTILASWTLQAREGVAGYDFVPYPAHHFQTAVGEALYVDVTAAVNVTINCIYTDDDAA